MLGRFEVEREICGDVRGCETLSKMELRVEELLLFCVREVPVEGCSSLVPSLEEVPDVDAPVSAVWNDAFDLRRKLKSFRNAGMA